MKLELKHLAPYIPYKIKYISPKREGVVGLFDSKDETIESMGLIAIASIIQSEGYLKPILRPLSDLDKEVNSFLSVPYKEVLREQERNNMCLWAASSNKKEFLKTYNPSYTVMSFLFKYHFDVFGLIKKGLAIDINTLSK